jgi:hypothetical protein
VSSHTTQVSTHQFAFQSCVSRDPDRVTEFRAIHGGLGRDDRPWSLIDSRRRISLPTRPRRTTLNVLAEIIA